MKKLFFTATLFTASCLFLAGTVFAQCNILPVEQFTTSTNFSTGTSTTTKYWSPSSCTTGGLVYFSSGGCTGGYVGYSGSWNNYFGCFLRTPQANCTGNSNVTLNFDISNSYFSGHPNDMIRFYMWVDGGYKNATSVKIGGIDVGYTDINGLWLKFSQARTCVNVDVVFDLTTCSNLSNILFYLEPNCGYNDGNAFSVVLDNITLKGAAPTANAGTNDTICSGASVQLNASGGTTYAWNPSAGLSSTNVANPTASPAATTIYYVTVSDACGSDADSVIIAVNPSPATPVITQSGDTLFSSALTGNQWYNAGGAIGGANNDTLLPPSTGNYFVIVTDGNGCVSDTSNIIYYSVTDIAMHSADDILHIYPNPATDKITIENSSPGKNVMISIYSIEGQLLMKRCMNTPKDEIDISGLAKGVYFLKVQNGIIVKKFMKE